MYYVYSYLRAVDSDTASAGTPYYIGKGRDYRAWDKRHGKVPVPKDKSLIVILETNLTNIGACAIERRMIRWYGRKDLNTGILLNRTDGGEGQDGWVCSEDTKIKIRNKLINREISIEQRQHLSKINTGKKHTDETKDKISNARKGKPRNAETKAKISATIQAKKLSQNKFS